MLPRNRPPGPRPIDLPFYPGGLFKLPPAQFPDLGHRDLEVLEAIIGFFGQVRVQRLRLYMVPARMPSGTFYKAIHRLEGLGYIRAIGTPQAQSYGTTRLHVVPLAKREAARRKLRPQRRPGSP